MFQAATISERSAILDPHVVGVPGLERMRMKVSLSQRELAKLSGIAASTIARIESGKPAHPSTIRKLAQALGCQPFDLTEPKE